MPVEIKPLTYFLLLHLFASEPAHAPSDQPLTSPLYDSFHPHHYAPRLQGLERAAPCAFLGSFSRRMA